MCQTFTGEESSGQIRANQRKEKEKKKIMNLITSAPRLLKKCFSLSQTLA